MERISASPLQGTQSRAAVENRADGVGRVQPRRWPDRATRGRWPPATACRSTGSTRNGAGRGIVSPSPAHVGIADHRIVPKAAACRRRTARTVDGDPRPVVHVPVVGVGGIDGHGSAVAGENLRPVRSDSGALHARRPVHAQAGQQGVRGIDDGERLSTSASEPRLPFRFWKCVASEAEQAEPVSPIASVERHRPLSLPTKISSGLAAFQASACWNSPTWALMQVVELVVLRHRSPWPGCTSTGRRRRPAAACPGRREPRPAPACSCRWRWSPLPRVLVSSAVVFHCCANVMVELVQAPPLMAHLSCHRP